MSVKQKNNISKVDQKEVKTAIAKLKNCPTSPRKMRLVADQIRGLDANKALILLKHSSKAASLKLEKLLLSAIANFQMKYADENADIIIRKYLLTQEEC